MNTPYIAAFLLFLSQTAIIPPPPQPDENSLHASRVQAGNINLTRYASAYSGANAGAKIASAATELQAGSGSVIDARDLEGDQTLSANPFSGVTKPVILLLGKSNYTWSSTAEPPAGSIIQGLGSSQTVLNVGNAQTAFRLLNSNIHISGLTLSMTDSGGTSLGIVFGAAVENVYLDDVRFVGNDITRNTFAIAILNHNVTNLFVRNCQFDGVTYPIGKDNNDPSVTRNTVFDGITVTNTGSGLNFNHPLDPGIRGKLLGSWTDITVTNSHFTGTGGGPGSWFIGLSGPGVKRATISNNTFTNSEQEQIHIEDSASEISIVGNRFQKYGTTTANGAGADHGLIQILSGAHHIALGKNVYDLADTGDGSDGHGVNIQPGGGSGLQPHHIDIIGDMFQTKIGNPAIVVSDAHSIRLSNSYTNVFKDSKAAYFVALIRSDVSSFNEGFHNPGALYYVDKNSVPVITKPHISGDFTTAPAFTWVTAKESADGSVGIPFDGFTIVRDFIADEMPHPLFPLGAGFNLSLLSRYQEKGLLQTFTQMERLKWNGSTLSHPDAGDPLYISGTSSVSGFALTTTATELKGTSMGMGGAGGTITISASGPFIAKP